MFLFSKDRPYLKGFAKRLVIMVKAPKAGAVKTRLGHGIGVSPATGFYRYTCQNVMTRLERDPRWQTILAVAPDVELTHPFWRSRYRMGQGRGDLGQRMQHVFDILPPGPVVIIGTDIPQISCENIWSAFERLGHHDAVFGPADDGGYWLVGQRRMPRVLSMFDNVRWSSAYTLSDSLANLEPHSVAMLDVLRDVDSAEEYFDLRQFGGRLVLPKKFMR